MIDRDGQRHEARRRRRVTPEPALANQLGRLPAACPVRGDLFDDELLGRKIDGLVAIRAKVRDEVEIEAELFAARLRCSSDEVGAHGLGLGR